MIQKWIHSQNEKKKMVLHTNDGKKSKVVVLSFKTQFIYRAYSQAPGHSKVQEGERSKW